VRFKPDGAREFHNYLHVVITVDEEDQRRPEDNRRYFNVHHRGQILICDMIDGIPHEVGTGTKPGKVGCQFETFVRQRDAIERAWLAVGADPGGYAGRLAYRYRVITETEISPRKNIPGYGTYYEVGQIVTCEVIGLPMEVGTWMKPGRINCQSEEFMELDKAINFSYEITRSGWSRGKKGATRKRGKSRGDRHRKFRHQA